MVSMSSDQNTTKKPDPLYTIFEQHLFNFQDPNADSSTFCETIVKEYLTCMRRLGLSVPVEWEAQISEELFFQVNAMLVKKIYGCQTIDQYTANIPASVKRKAQARYRSLERATRKAVKAKKAEAKKAA